MRELLTEIGINPELLKLGLTESLLLDNVIETIGKMNTLREIGGRFYRNLIKKRGIVAKYQVFTAKSAVLTYHWTKQGTQVKLAAHFTFPPCILWRLFPF